MLKIINWNVNSVRSRMPILNLLIKEHQPDVIMLQETKCTNENFPHLELESYGYNIATHGQKSYNGVAIMSKGPIEDVSCSIPNFEDDSARYIECITTIDNLTFRVASVYVPNGSDISSDKFVYKLDFIKALNEHLKTIIKFEEVILIGGDYNVATENIDVYDSNHLEGSIGFNIEERKLIRSILNNGYYDTFRYKYQDSQQFSWWDYRSKSFANNLGMRIDYILASPEAIAFLNDAQILKKYRELSKTSDHAPVLCTLDTNKISKSIDK